MSKIYVSYTTPDDEFAQGLMMALRAEGHQITVEGTKLTAGINWRAELNEGLKAAEVFIILISRSTMHSQYPMMELGTARAYAETSGKMLILPIVLGDLALPTIVQDIQVIFAREQEPQQLLPQIEQAISAFEGRRAAQEVELKEIQQAVQVNLADFVDDAIKTQQDYEKTHKNSAQNWYMIGYGSLVLGLATTAYLAYSVINTQTASPDYPRAISVSLLNVIAIAILAALARYAYSLGKSYMSESLKSSDRIHAIQFGRFFLRAYGNKATTVEIREVFQHWNIDRTSTFSSLDSSQIDPQIVNMVVQIVAAIRGKKDS
ncbi:toll/interleukin-1 receptor domain-containing protein [Mesorhizobium sp. M0207]|uniref:toll/interleukin-1 receptor domain-containing protein n=1 Tax=Mesorhizobium sp. M0207 TaxID=2956915 RepID=UPI0033368E91